MHPPLQNLDRMFIVSVWLESVVYGINCVLLFACIYTLVNQNRRPHRVLVASCIFHISVSTAHTVISLLLSLQGFTTPSITSVPNGSNIYVVSPTSFMLTNLSLFLLNVLAQDLLLIWRLYVVWNHSWKFVIPSLILEVAHIACASVAVFLISRPDEYLFSHNVQAFGKASWSLGLFLNTGITCGIAYRLWVKGREVSDLTGRNVYKAAMFTIIESGTLTAGFTLIMFALDVAGSPSGFMAFNVYVQLATTTPLLIITRLGLGLTSIGTHFEKSTSPTVTFAPVQIDVSEDSCTYPMAPMSPFAARKTGSMQSFYRGA
ncbi:uncharacterized protein EDB93DRAFT_1115644 [Suillus bovinus]|uniref:uncharacterized protein n=1 Tax=Suillus bovinus TaxID=48563 RepID=UPI001B85ED19|nr:uncharacterized protein EDB93DRAFT_1115644 [Suillus bovinus]KAG2159417.1 hypothetical protein EDB93DRAFT_1115644 [Suillus bovinus]